MSIGLNYTPSDSLKEKPRWPWYGAIEPTSYDEENDWPKISLITPSYNQGQYIEETILSIIHQNYPNLEYIIIDGGSDDNTIDIIKKYERYITYWISEPDKGQSDAINKGIAQCSGEIFNWVNSDDLLAPNSLFTVGRYFKNNQITVLGGYRRRFEQLSSLFPIDQNLDRVCLGINTEASLFQNHFIQLPTFYSLKAIQSLGGINPAYHYTMDSELWQRYLLHNGQQSVMLIDECLGYFRLHPQSKTVGKPSHFQSEASQFYQGLFVAADLHPEATKILTNECLKSSIMYDVTRIKTNKIREYAYAKLLQHYISLATPMVFIMYFLKYLRSSRSIVSGFQLLYSILQKRILARL